MTSIHQSSIDYLVELDGYLTRLGDEKEMPPSNILLIQKVKRTLESQALNHRTVAEIEKVVIFINQAKTSAQPLYTSRGIRYDPQLLARSLTEKLPLLLRRILKLEDASAIPEDSTFRQRIATAILTLSYDKAPPAPNWTAKTLQVTTGFAKTSLNKIIFSFTNFAEKTTGLVTRGLRAITVDKQKEKERLQEKTGSTVGAEAAKVATGVIFNALDDLLAIERFDPVARPVHAKPFYEPDSYYTNKPKLSIAGNFVKDTVVHSPDALKEFLESTLLQAMNNIVDFLQAVPEKLPDFLIDFCTKALQETVSQLKLQNINTENQVMELRTVFTEKLAQFLLSIALPKGAESLPLPTAIARNASWAAINEEIKKRLANEIESLIEQNDLFATLLSKGNDAIKKAMQPHAKKEMKPGKKEKAESELPPYRNQAAFNDTLYRVIDTVIEESPSKLLRFVARQGLRKRIDTLGPQIVDAIRNIDFVKFFNEGCSALVTAHQEIKQADPRKKTRHGLQELEQEEQERAKVRDQKVEALEKELCHTVDLAVDYAAMQISGASPKGAAAAEGAGRSVVQGIRRAWASFTCSMIRKGLSFAVFVLRVKPAVVTHHKNVKKLQVQPFLKAMNEFMR